MKLLSAVTVSNIPTLIIHAYSALKCYYLGNIFFLWNVLLKQFYWFIFTFLYNYEWIIISYVVHINFQLDSCESGLGISLPPNCTLIPKMNVAKPCSTFPLFPCRSQGHRIHRMTSPFGPGSWPLGAAFGRIDLGCLWTCFLHKQKHGGTKHRAA